MCLSMIRGGYSDALGVSRRHKAIKHVAYPLLVLDFNLQHARFILFCTTIQSFTTLRCFLSLILLPL